MTGQPEDLTETAEWEALKRKPPAKVGDRIEHGQPIPGNVVRMFDEAAVDDRSWRRVGPGRFEYYDSDEDRIVCEATSDLARDFADCWPMTVVEVDPEPQPAATPPRYPDCHECGTPWVEPADRLTAPDPSQPVVLRLPEVPEGTVALIDRNADRWTPQQQPGRWRRSDGMVTTYPLLLENYGPVTVEFAPPREPRTWPKIEVAPDGERGLMVEVEGYGRFARNSFGNWVNDDHSAPTFHALRELGDVTEVLS